jgi:hypothetical protein
MGDPNDKGLVQRDYTQRHSRSPAAPMPARAGAANLRLLDQLHLAIRTLHFSPHTEPAYVTWIKRFTFFHNTHHPAEMAS